MKRILVIVALVSMFFSITAFDCGSKELEGARLYIKQEQYDKAKEQLDAELAKNPKSDIAHYLYGQVLGREGDMSGMVEHYNKSLEISPTYKENIDTSLYYHWGTSYNKGAAAMKQMVNVKEGPKRDSLLGVAEKNFTNATICEPDSAFSFQGLTLVYLNSGELDKAVEPAKKYLAILHTPAAYSLVGDVYYSLGSYYMEKFKQSKENADSIKAIDQYDAAIEQLKEGREKYPNDKELLEKLSNMYIAANKLDVAMEAFKEGVNKNPQNKQYRYNYGVVLLNAGNLEEAANQFEKAIELDPEYANALYNLAVVYIRWGQKLREQDEENVAAGKEATSDYKAKFQKAIDPLEKYLEISPEESTIWSLLGKVYANIGESEKAADAFNKADEYRK